MLSPTEDKFDKTIGSEQIRYLGKDTDFDEILYDLGNKFTETGLFTI